MVMIICWVPSTGLHSLKKQTKKYEVSISNYPTTQDNPNRCIPPSVPVSYTQSNNPLKLFHLPTRIDIYKYSFLPRTINQWNQIPTSDIDKIDIETFKNNLIGIVCKCNGH